MNNWPTLAEFLHAPIEAVRKVAPPTMIYTPGGTRRAGVLAGIEPWSPEFVQWARLQMLNCCNVIFAHGVKNLILPALVPTNFQEVNDRHDQLTNWVTWAIAGSETMQHYTEQGWRVRLICDERVPQLFPVVEQLRNQTAATAQHTLYWTVTFDTAGLWQQLLARLAQHPVTTQDAAIQLCYGENIPPASLLLSFGKPQISYGLIPPLLLGDVECYWTQRAGYSVDTEQLRTILHDYAYLRRTWQPEKLTRAQAAKEHPSVWQGGATLGLGTRVGPFWYPSGTISERQGNAEIADAAG